MSEPNFSIIAGFYSQLAGVLAGFAFAGLIALVVAQFTSDSRASASFQSFMPLISSFIGLVGTSLGYAIISGEGSGDGRSAMLETVGGLAYCTAGLMLFYSLVVLLHGARADALNHRTSRQSGSATRKAAGIAISFTRRVLMFGIAPTIIVLFQGGIDDQELVIHHSKSGWHWIDWLLLAAVLVALAAATVCEMFPGWPVYRELARSISTPSSPVLVSSIAVAITLLCVAGISVIGIYSSPTSTGSDLLRIVESLILLGFVLTVINATSRYR